jgi:hypothetical protein
MRTIVAGSRGIYSYLIVAVVLDELQPRPTAILCGEARGVDKTGKAWSLVNKIPVESYPADWATYGLSAGPVRNRKMAENAERLVAFWDGRSRGTASMIDIANEIGLIVQVIRVKS